MFVAGERQCLLIDRGVSVRRKSFLQAGARTLLIHRRHRPFSRNNSARGRGAGRRKHARGISSASPPTRILSISRCVRPRVEFLRAHSALRRSRAVALPYKESCARESKSNSQSLGSRQKLFSWPPLVLRLVNASFGNRRSTSNEFHSARRDNVSRR